MASPRILLEDSGILIGEAPLQVAPSPPAGVTTLPHLFQHQARSQPRNVAFSCQTEHGLKQVTYSEADAIAASLALQIQSLHIHQPSDSTKAPTVAIWLEKGLDLILSILATTYSGATWLPLDPDVPVERVAVCCVDSSATAIICDSAHLDRARDVQQRVGTAIQVRTFDELSTQADAKLDAESPQLCGPSPRDAAYLIYTSGTTGTPKGIAIPHSAALTFSLSEREVLQTGPSDIVWNGFSPAFDMFIVCDPVLSR